MHWIKCLHQSNRICCRYSSVTKWPVLVLQHTFACYIVSYHLVPAIYHSFLPVNPHLQASIYSCLDTSSTVSYNCLASFPVVTLDIFVWLFFQFSYFFPCYITMMWYPLTIFFSKFWNFLNHWRCIFSPHSTLYNVEELLYSIAQGSVSMLEVEST